MSKKKGGCFKWFLICIGGIFAIGIISTFFTINDAIDRTSEMELEPLMTQAEIEKEAQERRQRSYERDFTMQTEKKVKQLFKDPSSVKLKGVAFGNSDVTGDAIYGEVNGKNSFGAYTGFKKFVSTGKTTLFENQDSAFKSSWLALVQARITKETLSQLPQDNSEIEIVIDLKAIAGKSIAEVNSLLGQPQSSKTVKQGKKKVYKDEKIEIVFINGKADWITVNDFSGVKFSPGALKAFGLPYKSPSYATKTILKWESLEGYNSINLFGLEGGECDYLYIKAFTE